MVALLANSAMISTCLFAKYVCMPVLILAKTTIITIFFRKFFIIFIVLYGVGAAIPHIYKVAAKPSINPT